MDNQTINENINQIDYQCIPRKIKRRLYLTGFLYAVCGFVALFLLAFFTNIFTGTIHVQQRISYLDQEEAFGNIDEITTNSKSIVEITKNYINSKNGLSMTSFNPLGGKELKTYRFGYKNKNFPELSQKYPVYKTNGIMFRDKTLNKYLKNLQIGDVSLKNLSNFKLISFEVGEQKENGYRISFDANSKKMHFYHKDSSEIQAFSGEIPSSKQIIKSVDKQLKTMNISMKNYGDAVVDDHYDINGNVRVFYPLTFQGYNVRNADSKEQEGISVFFNLNTQTIQNVINIDIASYEASNYSIKDLKDIESSIEQGGNYYSQGALHEGSTVILLNPMEVVYLEKLSEDGKTYYFVPAIKGTVSSSIENYDGPNMIFQELI